MTNERLMTDKECEGLEDPYPDWEYVATCYGCRRTLLYHQDRKTMAVLIGWLDGDCPHPVLAGFGPARPRRLCSRCWEELKLPQPGPGVADVAKLYGGGPVRLVKEGADEYQAGRTYVDITSCYAIKDTIEVNLNDFAAWYYDNVFSTDGGELSYKAVPDLIRQWMASLETK